MHAAKFLGLALLIAACGQRPLDQQSPKFPHPGVAQIRPGLLNTGSYLVAFDAPPEMGLADYMLRLDIREDHSSPVVADVLPRWTGGASYWDNEPSGDWRAEYDLWPGLCTACFSAVWDVEREDGARVTLDLVGLNGFQTTPAGIVLEAKPTAHLYWSVRDVDGDRIERANDIAVVPISLHPDVEAPEVVLSQRIEGPLLPWERIQIDLAEPLAKESLRFSFREQATGVEHNLGEPQWNGVGPDGAWWPLGQSITVQSVEGHDPAGNALPSQNYSAEIVPARPIVDIATDQLNATHVANWGSAIEQSGESVLLRSTGGPAGAFLRVRVAEGVRKVHVKLRACGPNKIVVRRSSAAEGRETGQGAPETWQADSDCDDQPRTLQILSNSHALRQITPGIYGIALRLNELQPGHNVGATLLVDGLVVTPHEE